MSDTGQDLPEPATACPESEELDAFVAGRHEDDARIREHVASCERCHASVSELARLSPRFSETVLRPDSSRAGWAASTQSQPRPVVFTNAPSFEDGQDVDHFRVIRQIGKGGMGEVYLARDTELGRKVALKVVKPDLLGSAQAVDRFMGEARHTARFNHPHIVTIYAVGQVEDAPYVALEYLEGQDLRTRLGQERPSLPESLRIALAVAEAIAEAHRHNVLHRDLKPANIFLCKDGRLRVVDFGLAHHVTEATEEANQTRATSEDAVMKPGSALRGTPAYMAPEQWRHEEATGAIDVWALGLILYELCVAKAPIEIDGLIDFISRISGETPMPSLGEAGDYSHELVTLVDGCLAKSASDRPTAAECVESLRELVYARGKTRRGEESPFRGLLAFGERHADVFFGRDAEIAMVAEHLRQEALVAVVGPSGAGKSSFVQAGVLPRLREQSGWTVLRLRPGDRPLERLAQRIVSARHPGSDSLDSSDSLRLRDTQSSDSGSMGGGLHTTDEWADEIRRLRGELRESPAQLALVLQDLARVHGGRVLILVDQLEELYTMTEDEGVQRAFLEAICLAADDPGEPVRAVLTLRDDFLARVGAGSPVVQSILQHLVVLRSPRSELLVDVLVRPLQACGYSFDDPSLAEDMVGEVDAVGGLPLLQFAARSLWDRRDRVRRQLRREDYVAIGGVAGALAQHADAVLKGLSNDELDLARKIMLRLVTPEHTRRVLDRAQLLDGLPEAAQQVLERLTQSRLLVVRQSRQAAGGSRVELAQESIVKTWPVLAGWLEKSRDELSMLAEAEQAAELWARRGRRPTELWSGSALSEARRVLSRGELDLPGQVKDFLVAAQRRERLAERRKRLILATLVVGLGIVALVLGIQKEEVSRQRDQAEQQRVRAEQQQVEALWESARGALARGKPLEARAKLRVALELEEAPSVTTRGLWWELNQEPLAWERGQGSVLYDVALSPDGVWAVSGGQDRVLRVYDIETGQVSMLRGHRDQILDLDFGSDGRFVASAGVDGLVWVWDLGTKEGHTQLDADGAPQSAVALHPEGRQVVAGGRDGVIRVWDVRTQARVRAVTAHDGPIGGLDIHPQGRVLTTVGRGGTLKQWSLPELRLLNTRRLSSAGASGVRYSPDGGRLATWQQGSVKASIWDLATWERVAIPVKGHVESMAWRPDGERVITVALEGWVEVWDSHSGAQVGGLPSAQTQVRGVDWSSDGRYVATGGFDNKVRLWRALAIQAPKPRVGHEGAVYALAWSPDGRQLLTGGLEGQGASLIWDMDTAEVSAVFDSAYVEAVDWSPRGDQVAIAGQDGRIRVWDAARGEAVHTLMGPVMRVSTVAFSPDGQRLAAGFGNADLWLWSLADDNPVPRKMPSKVSGSRDIFRIAWRPDGQFLVTGEGGGHVRTWSLENDDVRHKSGLGAGVLGLAWSPDGDTLYTGGMDAALSIWDGSTLALRRRLKTKGRINHLALDFEAKQLALALSTHDIALMDLQSDHMVHFSAHSREVNGVAFSPDGERLASIGDDGTVRLWRAKDGWPIWRPGALNSVPAPSAWEGLVATEARLKARSRTRQTGCVWDRLATLQHWDLEAMARVGQVAVESVRDLVALPSGCGVLRAQAVMRLGRDAEIVTMGVDNPLALAAMGDVLLVATESDVHAFGPKGEVLWKHPVGRGISALTGWGSDPKMQLAVGYVDGYVELIRRAEGEGRAEVGLVGFASSTVTRLIRGPQDTLVAGYADGSVLMWNLADGHQLRRARLHGAIVDLAFVDGALEATSDLGKTLRWDFEVLSKPVCVLLREVWAEVPVVWQRGRAVAMPAPEKHRCVEASEQE